MRISTVREFRDHATSLLRNDEPLLVTRRGRLAGVYLPWTKDTVPQDLQRELFLAVTQSLAGQLKAAGTQEQEVLKDFDAWKKARAAARRRR